MFSMCSGLTPRARITDTRIPQLMQPWVEQYSAESAIDIRTSPVQPKYLLYDAMHNQLTEGAICFSLHWLRLTSKSAIWPQNICTTCKCVLHCIALKETKIFLETATKAKIHNIYLKLYYALNRSKIKIPHNDHPAAAWRICLALHETKP